MRVIPSIDIIGGKCVRLTQGDYGKMKVFRENPLEVAKEFEEADLEYVHVVDLDGAKKGKVVNWHILEAIQERTALRVDFGGGVKSEEDVERLLDLGIDQINVGSLAAKEPDVFSTWLKKYGSENFILSVDVKEELVQSRGWTEQTDISIYDLATGFEKEGLQYIIPSDAMSVQVMY